MIPAPLQAPPPVRYVPPLPKGWQPDTQLEFDERGFLFPARRPMWKRVIMWITSKLKEHRSNETNLR